MYYAGRGRLRFGLCFRHCWNGSVLELPRSMDRQKNIKMAHRKNIQEGIRRGSDQRRAGDAREDDCEDGECKGGGGGAATACCCWVQ
jgi:hypothetical protein